MPKSCPCATKKALENTKKLLQNMSLEEKNTHITVSEQISETLQMEDLQVIEHSFTDKILVSRSSTGQVKSVSRSLQDGEFHLNQIDFSAEPTSHLSLINLNINPRQMLNLLQVIDWNEVLKGSCVENETKAETHLRLDQS